MMNFRDSHTSIERSKPIATGSSVPREGVVLVGVLEGGVEVVKPATGTGTDEVVVGFSKLDSESFTTDVHVEQITIPAVADDGGDFLVKLQHGGITGSGATSYDIRIVLNGGSPMVQDASPDASGDFYVSDPLSGELAFHSADKGKTATVYYKRNLTAVEAQRVTPGVRSINNAAAAQLGTCTVKGGVGEIYTKEYDVNADFSTGTLTVMAGGVLTMDGAGTDLSGMMRVIKLPDANDAHLGLAINIAL